MGRVVFIGAGPGAADLITVRGAARLREAEVVLFDALTDPALRDLAPQAEWVNVGKRGFDHAVSQSHINGLLLQHARAHGVVVRLKGGDPSLFGRLEEELQTLQAAGIATEVVPGVTSALAAAAALQRPLTRRGLGRSVSFATAMTRTLDVHACRSADTEVFYMASRQLGPLSRQLQDAGWDAATPVLVISRAGWSDQLASDHTVATLAEAGALHGGRPSVVTVGIGATAVGSAAQNRPDPPEPDHVSSKTAMAASKP
ncbi:MAG: uroporphyrinogen-III C-methyltransferase [Burkholderiales bacterium]